MMDGTYSTVCTNNKVCKSETLSSSLPTKHSYFSAKRFSFTFLNQTAFNKITVKSEQHCIKKCMSSLTCSSMNLVRNLTSDTTSVECHLLTQQAYSNKGDLTYQENSTHLTAMNTGCENDICMNNATCIPNYMFDAASCKCSSTLMSGTYCEEEKKVVSMVYLRGNGRDSNIYLVLRDANFKTRLPSTAYSLTFSGTASDNYITHMFAYFLPPDNGMYYFHMTCTWYGLMYISTPGKQNRRVLVWGTGTNSKSVYMEKSSKRLIEIVTGGQLDNGQSPIILGVTLPNNTKYSPIPHSFFDSLLLTKFR
ncbi:uncharacterized protein LOC101240928 isoform X4 [Hydra vulgaris]